ncbi:26592_t:CDS:2 [Gigaspora margarita]|uniref:26592_t:CDS:1 n=1 Tax=Gigaspora margarita TaxID=4874 RepID=A0ABN7UZ69_GIGMA|nr:26592_t:CDS:2 [Gigaspora margarita]
MAIVTNLLRNNSDHSNISFFVETRNFMDQDSIVFGLKYYYLKSATHLAPTTNLLKKRAMPFMNRELLIIDNTYIVYLHADIDKVPVAHTIASRVKNSRCKKISTATIPYLRLNK